MRSGWTHQVVRWNFNMHWLVTTTNNPQTTYETNTKRKVSKSCNKRNEPKGIHTRTCTLADKLPTRTDTSQKKASNPACAYRQEKKRSETHTYIAHTRAHARTARASMHTQAYKRECTHTRAHSTQKKKTTPRTHTHISTYPADRDLESACR